VHLLPKGTPSLPEFSLLSNRSPIAATTDEVGSFTVVNPDREAGRVTLITRYGANKVRVISPFLPLPHDFVGWLLGGMDDWICLWSKEVLLS